MTYLKFEVLFKSTDCFFDTHPDLEGIGLDGVDLIRDTLKYNIDIEHIRWGYQFGDRRNAICFITEDDARSTEQLYDRNRTTVAIVSSTNNFEEYIHTVVSSTTDNDGVETAWLRKEVDVLKLYRKWAIMGYPITMNFNTCKNITKFTGRTLHDALMKCCEDAEVEKFATPELNNNNIFECYFDHDDVVLCLANGELSLYNDYGRVLRIETNPEVK